MQARPSSAAGLLPSSSPHSSHMLLDTSFLIGLRVLYFLLARRFLQYSLNSTLRDLSKPELLLPLIDHAADRESKGSEGAPKPQTGALTPRSECELNLDTEDEDLFSHTTPASSYPASPARSQSHLSSTSKTVRESFIRRVSDDPSNPNRRSRGEHAIQMADLGERLRDLGGVGSRVLQLSHPERSGGTKAIRRATKGLSRVSRWLFSFCFAEGCNLITLVVFHMIGFLNSRSRQVNFSLSLYTLLALILLVVPMVQCMLLTYRSREPTSTSTTPSSISFSSRLLIALIPFSLYIFLFSRIPPYVTTVSSSESILPNPVEVSNSSSSHISVLNNTPANMPLPERQGWEGSGLLASGLGRVVVLGVVVLGGLSGFGAVRTAWTFYEHFRGIGSRHLTDNDLLQAERSLYRIRHDLALKREEVSRLNRTVIGSDQSGRWLNKVLGGSRDEKELAGFRAELSGLQTMEVQTSSSLRSMRLRKKRQEYGRTLSGKMYNLMGYVFAFYCAARILMCLPSLFFAPLSTSQVSLDDSERDEKGNTNGDWISFLLALGISHLPTGFADVDVAFWSRAISLALTGLLILSSLSQTLRSVSRIVRLTSKTAGAGFLLLSLGQLFLRTTLPTSEAYDQGPLSPAYGNSTVPQADLTRTEYHESLLASLPDFRVFGRVFDVVFLVAALGTGLYRYISMRVTADDDSGDVYKH